MLILKYIEWLFWVVFYSIKPIEKNIEGLSIRYLRIRYPFKKFKPFLYRNEEGKQWEIYFKDDDSYFISTKSNINVGVHVSYLNDEITSLTIFDEELTRN